MNTNNNTASIQEVENGWIVTVGETTMVYHTWHEVVQFLNEEFGEQPEQSTTEQSNPYKGYDAHYPWGRGF